VGNRKASDTVHYTKISVASFKIKKTTKVWRSAGNVVLVNSASFLRAHLEIIRSVVRASITWLSWLACLEMTL
jgi:hypothetical protein